MRATDFVTEGLAHPIICVDVQPEYNGAQWPVCFCTKFII